MNIQNKVSLAAKCIAPVWPLNTFIACNPLQGLETEPFEKALNQAAFLFEEKDSSYEAINRETLKWCSAYFDKEQSVIPMPSHEQGFYAVFKSLAAYDQKLHQGSKRNKQWLNQLPPSSEEAIEQCLKTLNIADENHIFFLKKSLAQLPGWSGYIKWLSEWKTHSSPSEKNILIDFTAVLLIISVLFKFEFKLGFIDSIKEKEIKQRLEKIQTLEKSYQADLIPALLNEAKNLGGIKAEAPEVQLVFCIDVRSEPFRRQLESLGLYETLGFAGFFGLPIRLYDYHSGAIMDSCPVLLKPAHDIHESPCETNRDKARHNEKNRKILEKLKSIYQKLKYNFATTFALVETLGAGLGLLMLLKTLQPVRTVCFIKKSLEIIRPRVKTKFRIEANSKDPTHGIAESDQIAYAEGGLHMMGLTKEFGKLIVFCGHGSATQNNPYASGLDCGACGGNAGGGNAKVLAAILNKASIRQALFEKGIAIPAETQFLAAEHNTTTDDFQLFDETEEPCQHAVTLAQLQKDLQLAKALNSASRIKDFDVLGQVDAVEEIAQRSQDWSEVRPEWALARNAAFIIGPRELSKTIDLKGRSFLHSYDWTQDENLSSLETILTAPMVVAEWINTQYLFSTLHNVSYGGGSKLTQNVTGKMALMQGNGSDLMHGLPLQSVNSSDDLNYHQPQRLLTVIYAPREKVSTIIHRQAILQTLFFNAWVLLVVIEPGENKAYQLDITGGWHLLNL